MHRKLINTFRALGLVLSLATAALITATPFPGATDTVSARGTTTTPADLVPASVAPQVETESANTHSRHRRAQAREALALPFFSFAQGLRSGNRS